jgi:hypothetical protein
MSRPAKPARDERGGSQTVMVLLIMASLILVAGLVVDGGRKVAAAERAEAAAAGAARAGADASATSRLADRIDTTTAVLAARQYLAATPQVSGSVQLLAGGKLQVITQSTRPTVYLSAIGMSTVTGRGNAVAQLRQSEGPR